MRAGALLHRVTRAADAGRALSIMTSSGMRPLFRSSVYLPFWLGIDAVVECWGLGHLLPRRRDGPPHPYNGHDGLLGVGGWSRQFNKVLILKGLKNPTQHLRHCFYCLVSISTTQPTQHAPLPTWTNASPARLAFVSWTILCLSKSGLYSRSRGIKVRCHLQRPRGVLRTILLKHHVCRRA